MPRAPRKRATKGDEAASDTRTRLVRAALHLFAEGGVRAVSTRAIQAAAGSHNASAIQYHFGNKAGLVEAVMGLVGQRLGTPDPALRALATPDGDRRALFAALLRPYIQLYLDPDIGRDAIKFISRLQMEPDVSLRPAFRAQLGPYTRQIEQLMGQAFPELTPEAVRLRLLFTFSLVVHGFASAERVRDSSLGEMESPPPQVLLSQFVQFLAGAWSTDV